MNKILNYFSILVLLLMLLYLAVWQSNTEAMDLLILSIGGALVALGVHPATGLMGQKTTAVATLGAFEPRKPQQDQVPQTPKAPLAP